MDKNYVMFRTQRCDNHVSLFFSLLLLVQGCNTVTDANYTFLKTNCETKSQRIQVGSTPNASLYLDGKPMGHTPTTIDLTYEQRSIELEKRTRRIGCGTQAIISREPKVETIDIPRTYTIELKASGFIDKQMQITCPCPKNTISPVLEPELAVSDPKPAFLGSDNETITQQIHVISTPVASVYLDSQYVGQTPTSVDLTYDRRIIKLEKTTRQIGNGTQTIVSAVPHSETLNFPQTHNLEFKATGYSEQRVQITSPTDKKDINVTLKHEEAVISPIKCTVHIEARNAYFQDIEKVLRSFSIEGTNVTAIGTRQKVHATASIEAQQFVLKIHSPATFVALTEKLQSLAKVRNFAFVISEAQVQAIYRSNELNTVITIIISGQGRPDAIQYLIRNKKPTLLNPDSTGQWRQEVVLSLGENVVHHLSVFRDRGGAAIIPVFNEINIYSPTTPKELDKESFIMRTGIQQQVLDELIHSVKPVNTTEN